MAHESTTPAAAEARDKAADERDDRADDREAALCERESLVDAVESAQAHRDVVNREILELADGRDEVADSRDAAADTREAAASLAAFLDHEPHDQDPEVRRAAALDRRHSKADRASASVDRSELADGTPATPDQHDD
jgi:hypothetical protein